MAHFATLDSNNKIINVEVVNNAVITDSNGDEQEQLGIDFLEQIHGGAGVTYKQTSYNENIRKNFAQVGGTYDASKDAFIPVKPFDSWVLNNTTCKWEAPTTYPTDGKSYGWDEDTTSWREIPNP
tara:strand:- start:172 stop:546 length:375 start_codon:yes stop_codon:yes gene_type:complete